MNGVRVSPTGRFVLLSNADLVGGPIGTVKGTALAGGVVGVLQDLSGLQQGEAVRFGGIAGQGFAGPTTLNDYVPPGPGTVDTLYTIEIDPGGGNTTLTGLIAPTLAVDGKRIRIRKLGNSDQVLITNEDLLSSAFNRFVLFAGRTLVLANALSNAIFVYQSGLARWVLESYNPGVVTTVADGYAPLSAGGTANFLRADLTWQPPTPVAPAQLAPFVAPQGVPFNLYVPFVAGGSVDVTVQNPTQFNLRLLDSWMFVSTPVAVSSATLRTATGGGGTPLSSALAATLAGVSRNNDTATRTVAAGGGIFLNRSSNGIAGEICVSVVRT